MVGGSVARVQPARYGCGHLPASRTAGGIVLPTYYTGSPQFYTADFRLFPFDSNLYTGRLVITPQHGLLMLPTGTSLTAQYEFYKSTTNFEAGIFTLGVRMPLKHP